MVLGLDVRDLTGGFKCFAAEVLEAIDLDSVRSRGYAFQVELTYRAVCAGFRVAEIPITFRNRTLGSSKMSWRIAAEAAWLVPQLRRGADRSSGLRSAPDYEAALPDERAEVVGRA
jgi:dolichol-phosphate mannosyltransferase